MIKIPALVLTSNPNSPRRSAMSGSAERPDGAGDNLTVSVLGSPTAADSRRRQSAFSRSSSPSHASQATAMAAPTSPRKADWAYDNSCAALLRRHKFLIVTMVILFILCAVYLYFAISMGE